MKVLNLREISKTAPWNSSKSWVNILRTTVAEWGWTRRHENGAFGTEIFRRIRQEGSRSPKIHHTLIIINYSPNKNLHLGFRQKLGSKFCVPPLWQGGGRNATKSGRSVLKFSGESARNGPGARKSPKNGKTENLIFQKTTLLKVLNPGEISKFLIWGRFFMRVNISVNINF